MKFSIRDLLLVTVIVAILTAWWVDRATRNELKRRTAEEVKKAETVQKEFYHVQRQLALARDGLEAQQRAIDYLKSRLPNSSAPAPNRPKGNRP